MSSSSLFPSSVCLTPSCFITTAAALAYVFLYGFLLLFLGPPSSSLYDSVSPLSVTLLHSLLCFYSCLFTALHLFSFIVLSCLFHDPSFNSVCVPELHQFLVQDVNLYIHTVFPCTGILECQQVLNVTEENPIKQTATLANDPIYPSSLPFSFPYPRLGHGGKPRRASSPATPTPPERF